MVKRKTFGPEDQMELFFLDQEEPILSIGTLKEGVTMDAAWHLKFGIPMFDSKASCEKMVLLRIK
jgi:hypothetical protein